MFRSIAADASAPLGAAVVGPGGTGKTLLLDRIAAAYERAEVEVLRVSAGERPVVDPHRALLVDDAHLLDPAEVASLCTAAEAGDLRLVVAYRPWPRSSTLAALGASVARERPVIVLGHLSREDVGTRIARTVGCTPPEAMIDLVYEQSGGLPAFADLVTGALCDGRRFDPRHPDRFRRPNRVTVSPGRAERLRYQMDALEPDVHALLRAMAVGAALDAEVLAAVLDVAPEGLTDTVEAARATGLITEDGRLIPLVQSLVLRLTPVLDTRAMQRRLADVQLRRGGSVLEAGRRLLGTGASGARVAAVLEAAGNEALRESPELAAELFAGAVEAGGSSTTMAARRARAAALSGRLDDALRLADESVCDPKAPDADEAVAVLAAVLAHRGLPVRSAELYQRMPPGSRSGAALAVPSLVGVGALERARAVLEPVRGAEERLPSLLAEAETLMAQGVIESVTGSPVSALSQLARAAALLGPAGSTVLLPDSPAALTALVALHRGELSVAGTALRSGLTARLGGRPARIRGLLLFGWLAMVRGDLAGARRALDRATAAQARFEPRDELWAAALAVGLARREDDAASLPAQCSRARDALVGQPVDLYTLQPLGELVVAAARLGDSEWVAPHVAEAEDLLERLGWPPLWAVPLHWYRLIGAVLAEDTEGAERQEAALTDAASSSPYAGTLAAAARSWLQVHSGEVDRETVESAARGLHGIGLAWEGARLAGQAASRVGDRRVAAALHACARVLQGSEAKSDVPTADGAATAGGKVDEGGSAGTSDGPAAGATATAPGAGEGVLVKGTSVLSEREFEVSQLILEGLTYKQIGERLFISAKTVEHHVARIRQRLGASTRKELFGQLRPLVPAEAPPAGT